jgi:hypothetical protein
MLIDVTICGDINAIKKEAEQIFKYQDLIIKYSATLECEIESDTSNNRGDCYHSKITQTIPDKHNRKARN